ncbi:MAG: type II secretion system protein GspD [Prevotella sp.]|jgi:type IV pilus assembly protein PilQ|nr:type II secretion system protein GspD [Prevotella sp.]
MKSYFVFFILLIGIPVILPAQSLEDTRLAQLKGKLQRLSYADSRYAEKVDVSVTNFPVSELIKSLAKAQNLNINVAFGPDKLISCNLQQVLVIDILFFICKEKSLEVEIMDNILSVIPYQAPEIEPPIHIAFDPLRVGVTFDFSDCRLELVTKKFMEATGCNIIIPQPLYSYRVSAYGQNMEMDEAVRTIAAVNGLQYARQSEKSWSLYRMEGGGASSSAHLFSFDEMIVDSVGLVTAKITAGNVREIVPDLFRRLGVNYFISNEFEHATNINVEEVDLHTFLNVLFTGTNITWKIDNGVYIIGSHTEGERLSTVQVFPMKYRTADKVSEYIPAELKANVEIITFPDLNSLVINGDQRSVIRIMNFLNEIDRSVPLISFDVIIVDATDKTSQSIGLSMGVGNKPSVGGGTISPGIDFSMSAASVNKIINSFNGFGSINLGKVTPNFYADLKFLEDAGKIILRSTPRLSTLNGHKAVLKSGEVKYYKESQVNIIGTQNPLQSESYLWKNVEANFVLEITPYVSLDSVITLQVNLDQAEFTVRESSDEDAPPGMTKRSFESIIKVKDQEMVLLGGIEKNLTDTSSRGLPFLARIPVLRLLFGNTTKVKSSEKLNVFIKPTIIQ